MPRLQRQRMDKDMRRTIIILSFLLLIASAGAAQDLPFTIMCLADSDKPLEVTFCKHIFAAAQARPGMRPSTADDTSAVIVMVIPKEEGDIAAVAVHVASVSYTHLTLPTTPYV